MNQNPSKFLKDHSFLNNLGDMGKRNDRNISKTKGLYEKKSLLRREDNNQMTIKDNNNFYKGYDSCNLISNLMNKYKKRNMRLPHINSRDKHNIFKQSPLLQSGATLNKDYLLHQEQSVVNNTNKYLENILKNINCIQKK